MRPTVDARRLAAQRPEGQRRRQRLAVAIIGALVLVLTGIVVTGYVIIFVLPPQQLVVRVGDVTFTRGDMVKYLRLRQATVQATGGELNAGENIFEALQLITENEIIFQSAPRFGISVTRQQIDEQIRSIMEPNEFDRVGKDDAQIEREYRERYRSYLNLTQATEEEHRELVRKSILREKFRQFIGDQVPLVAEQVYVHRILMSSQDEVEIMQTKLKDALGGDKSPENIKAVFEAISTEFSIDPLVSLNKGDLGWVPLGVDEDYEYDFFDLEVGELSISVPNQKDPRTLYFFMLSDRAGNRALDPLSVDTLKTKALQDWLNEERPNHDVFSEFNSDIYAWMLEQLSLTDRLTPTPVPSNVISGR